MYKIDLFFFLILQKVEFEMVRHVGQKAAVKPDGPGSVPRVRKLDLKSHIVKTPAIKQKCSQLFILSLSAYGWYFLNYVILCN